MAIHQALRFAFNEVQQFCDSACSKPAEYMEDDDDDDDDTQARQIIKGLRKMKQRFRAKYFSSYECSFK